MKLERSTKEYGSGKATYQSENFSVVRWVLGGEIKITIGFHLAPFRRIEFDGDHSFSSDDECREQFTAEEILGVIEFQKGRAFTEGQESKAQQIRDCLAI